MVEQIAPELVERMVALVRSIDSRAQIHGFNAWAKDAAAIVADLPKPIDPDLIEAREYYIQARGGVDCDAIIVQAVRRGERDQAALTQTFLAAIKRGRSLARTDQEPAHG